MQFVVALLLLVVLALDALGGLVSRWMRNSQTRGQALQPHRHTRRDNEL